MQLAGTLGVGVLTDGFVVSPFGEMGRCDKL